MCIEDKIKILSLAVAYLYERIQVSLIKKFMSAKDKKRSEEIKASIEFLKKIGEAVENLAEDNREEMPTWEKLIDLIQKTQFIKEEVSDDRNIK